MKIKDLSDDDFNQLYDTLVKLNDCEPLPYYTDNVDRPYTKEEVRNDYELIIAFFNRIIVKGDDNTWFKIVDKMPDEYHTTMLYTIRSDNKEFTIFKKIWRQALITNSEYWKWNDEIIITEI